MKTLLLTIVLVATIGMCYAGGPPNRPQQQYNNWGYNAQRGYNPSFQSRPNPFGGQNYYNSGRYMGQSRPNVYGGYNYWSRPNVKK